MLNETRAQIVSEIKDNKEDIEYIVEIITYVKYWLILFLIIAIKVILSKTVKVCKRIYEVHNERVIRKNNELPTSISQA